MEIGLKTTEELTTNGMELLVPQHRYIEKLNNVYPFSSVQYKGLDEPHSY